MKLKALRLRCSGPPLPSDLMCPAHVLLSSHLASSYSCNKPSIISPASSPAHTAQPRCWWAHSSAFKSQLRWWLSMTPASLTHLSKQHTCPLLLHFLLHGPHHLRHTHTHRHTHTQTHTHTHTHTPLCFLCLCFKWAPPGGNLFSSQVCPKCLE